MIIYKAGNLIESDMQTLVNTVNCVGVMGKGIALEFKNRNPEMYRDFAERCRRGEVKPGVPYRYPSLPDSTQLSLGLDADTSVGMPDPVIVNFPTKNHWRGKSKREYVERGLQILKDNHRPWGIRSLAVPALGCGNGGLDWQEIGPLMRDYLADLDIPVEIYVPQGINPDSPFPGYSASDGGSDEASAACATCREAVPDLGSGACIEVVRQTLVDSEPKARAHVTKECSEHTGEAATAAG